MTRSQTVAVDLVETARALEPVLRREGPASEAARRPTTAMLDALRDSGLLRMFAPRSLGGLEADPPTFARVIETAASADAIAGWVIQVASVQWWFARLPDEGVEEVYAAGPDTFVASAFYPPLRAVRSGAGFRVSGRARLASNVGEAQWLLVTAAVESPGPGDPAAVATICRADEVEILDTWRSLGMRGTDSNDVAVDGVLVPERRTFPLVPDFVPGSRYGAATYRFPGIGEAVAVGPPVALATARRAIDAFREIAEGKTPFGSATTLRERRAAHAGLGRAEGLLRSARALLHDSIGEAWERTLRGDAHTLEDKAGLLLAGAHATTSAVQAVDVVYGLAGTSGIYEASPLERHFRDVQTLRQHGFASESRYEAVGQVLLGVEPEFGMVAF